MLEPPLPPSQWGVLKIAAEAADRIGASVRAAFDGMTADAARYPVGQDGQNLAAIRAAVQAAQIGTPPWLAGIWGAPFATLAAAHQFSTWNWVYQLARPAEYAAKKKHLIEIPDPGTLMAALIKDGYTCESLAKEGSYKDGLMMHGLAWPQRLILERAARTRLDPRSYWIYKNRIDTKPTWDLIEKLRMAGLFAGDIDIFLEVQKELLPARLILNLYWRGILDLENTRGRLMEAGYKKEYCEQLISMSEDVLPPDAVVRGWHRETFDVAEASKRLRATGMREDDIFPYLSLSTTLLTPDLVTRGLWRGLWTQAETADRIRALGVDGADAVDWPRLLEDVLTPADAARLLYAGRLSLDGYRQALRTVGVAEQTAAELTAWPWQPIPASETLRLLLADKITADTARHALGTTGIPPATVAEIVKWPYTATGLGTVKLLFNRGVIDSTEARERILAGGMRPDDARDVSLHLHDPLPVDALFQLYRRDLIDRETVTRGLRHAGYTADMADRFADLAWVVPGPQDVISFAVKDVFEPDVVEHFGYAEEFPPEFVIWAKKAGIPEEVARLYWYAHWYVPGIGEVMEMYHRIKPGQRDLDRRDRETWCTDRDVDIYLKTQDYPPWWRDRVKAISYSPISRVDIRRAYQAGLADEEDVYETNRALGYSHDNSTILLEWTKWEYMPEDHTLLVAKVRDGLMDGSVGADDARSLLAEIGLSADRITLILDWAEYERERGKKDLTRATVQKLYVEGWITEPDTRIRLAAMRYGGEEIELLLGLWSIDREAAATVTGARAARPSRTDLAAFWRAGVIGEQDWTDEMAGLGFGDKYTDWYKIQALQKWTDDEIATLFVNGLMLQDTMIVTLWDRNWPAENIDALIDARAERIEAGEREY